MEASNELIGLSAAAVATVIILREVFNFISKMKTNGQLSQAKEESGYVGFTEIHAQCLNKVEYQVNEIYTGLQVNKELQQAIASVIGMQKQQTAILEKVADLLEKLAENTNE